jgi:hypothetical protein
LKATPYLVFKTEQTTKSWYQFPDLGTKDDYQFFLDAGPLSNLDFTVKTMNFGNS